MDPATEQAIRANLFAASHEAVSSWDDRLWHRSGGQIDTMRPNSSQALAIDVFGTLQVAEQEVRDAVLGELATELRLPAEGPWQIELEWIDSGNELRESGARSQIDAVAKSPRSLIFVECKFTEADGGCCSQPNPISSGPNKGKIQCNGNYSQQTNPVTLHEGKCALTSKGIRYWEIGPKVLRLDPTLDYSPCPFSGPVYQWMRNLSLCWLQAAGSNRRPGFLVVYADAQHLPMAQKIRTQVWLDFQALIRRDQIEFGTFSYQQIIQKALQVIGSEAQVQWNDLQNWVDRKISMTRKS
jgi:hypothetical protein